MLFICRLPVILFIFWQVIGLASCGDGSNSSPSDDGSEAAPFDSEEEEPESEPEDENSAEENSSEGTPSDAPSEGSTSGSEEVSSSSTSTSAEAPSSNEASASSSASSSSTTSGCEDYFSFTGTPSDIAGGLDSLYEPSGADFYEPTGQLLLVSDAGTVTMMDSDGTNITEWTVSADLEGITDAPGINDYFYLGVENPDAIKEFDPTTGAVLRTFTLTTWMTGADNQGLEGLIFVPDSLSNEGGYFYAAHQGEGSIYIFELPIQTSSTSTSVTFINKITPVSGRTNLAGLDYDSTTGHLYAAYDSGDKLVSLETDGTFIEEWNLPHTDQEGFAVNSNCDIVIAEDTGRHVWFYEGPAAPFEVTVDFNVLTLLANRMNEVQNDDGSFDWQQDVSQSLTPESTGYQNVTGVSALGLFDFIDRAVGKSVATQTWEATLALTVDYFEGLIAAFIADPSDTSNSISCPNWTLLARYLADYPDATLQSTVVDAFGQLLDARDTTYGDDSTMRVDGLMNRIIQGRASIPGIIPWDMALCAEAVESMAGLSANFDQDASDGLSLLADTTQNIFLPAYDADTSYTYGDISLSMPLFVLATSSAASSYSSLVSSLTTRLQALINPSGYVTNGSANDNPYQATAYALLALKALEHDSSQTLQNYLESLVNTSGGIVDSATNLETFEVNGEVLRALAY